MNVLMVGAGGMGGIHSLVYEALPDVQITAVVDIREEKAQTLAEKFGAKKYLSLEEALKNENPDLVDICTPSYLHAEMALACMEKKLNVLCEKPIALKVPDARKMVAASKQYGVYFIVAHVVRFWPEFMYLKTAVEEKKYGELRMLRLSRMGSLPLWSWDGWMLDEARSGLAPYDLHVHDTDFLVHLLGVPQSVDSRYVNAPDLIANMLTTRYNYAQDIQVEAESGWIRSQIPFDGGYRAIFDQASLIYEQGKLSVYTPYDDGKTLQGVEIELGDALEMADSGINISTVGPYFTEIAYFVDCIRNGKPAEMCPPEGSLNSLLVVDKEMESARLHKTVEI